MAKKKPKNNTSTVATPADKAATADAKVTAQTAAPQKAAVNVDTKQESSKSKQKAKKTQDKPNIFKRMWKGIKGLFSELKKVIWPKGKEVGSNTAVVLVVVVLFFVILFVIDYVLTGLLGLVTTGAWTHLWN